MTRRADETERKRLAASNNAAARADEAVNERAPKARLETLDAKTGAADAVRGAGQQAKKTARRANTRVRSTARQARKVPGVAHAEGQIKGAAASEQDLPIARYDSLTAADVLEKLSGLSQIALDCRLVEDLKLLSRPPVESGAHRARFDRAAGAGTHCKARERRVSAFVLQTDSGPSWARFEPRSGQGDGRCHSPARSGWPGAATPAKYSRSPAPSLGPGGQRSPHRVGARWRAPGTRYPCGR
jgi:hypothetical protein